MYLSITFVLCYYIFFPVISCRTYADKLSPKVVQSLLDLLCSQLKNLLSQAGVLLMASFGEVEGEEGEEEEKKVDSSGETEKRDFRGIINLFLCQFYGFKMQRVEGNDEKMTREAGADAYGKTGSLVRASSCEKSYRF